MHPPATAIGDADLLDIDVHHVTGSTRHDGTGHPVGLTGGVDEPAPVPFQRDEMPAHRSPADRYVVASQLEGDPRRRPLPGPSHRFDLGEHLCRVAVGCRCGAQERSSRPSSPDRRNRFTHLLAQARC